MRLTSNPAVLVERPAGTRLEALRRLTATVFNGTGAPLRGDRAAAGMPRAAAAASADAGEPPDRRAAPARPGLSKPRRKHAQRVAARDIRRARRRLDGDALAAAATLAARDVEGWEAARLLFEELPMPVAPTSAAAPEPWAPPATAAPDLPFAVRFALAVTVCAAVAGNDVVAAETRAAERAQAADALFTTELLADDATLRGAAASPQSSDTAGEPSERGGASALSAAADEWYPWQQPASLEGAWTPPAAAGAAAAETTSAVAAVAAGCGRCSGCGKSFPLLGFSNKQRPRLRKGAALCRGCVAATRCPQRPPVEFQRSSADVGEVARATAFEEYQMRLGELRARRQRGAEAAAQEAAAAAAAARVPVLVPLAAAAGGPLAAFALDHVAPFLDGIGRRFASLAQFLAHRKCLCMGDAATAARVLAEGADPATATRLGGSISAALYREAVWRQHAPAAAAEALRRRCDADPEAAALLLATGSAPLAAAGSDAAWGVGADVEDCRDRSAAELAACGGRNLLGAALESCRGRLDFRRRVREHEGPVPYCCSAANGGIDFEELASLLELYAAALPVQERAVVRRARAGDAAGARWQDEGTIQWLRDIATIGGVPSNFEANGGVLTEDRVCGSNSSMDLDEILGALRLLRAEEDAGQVLKYATRQALRDAGFDAVLVSPIATVPKMSDGQRALKCAVDPLTGLLRDGVHAPLLPKLRWIDDASRETSNGAEDSLNHFSPLSKPVVLGDLPHVAARIMALKAERPERRGRRRISGAAVDISNAYRNLPLEAASRRLHVFRFLDPDKPVPGYVLAGGQPREEDMVWFVKQVCSFGWRLSVDYWTRLAEAVKALYLWVDLPGMEVVLPADDYDCTVYVDDFFLACTAEHGGRALERFLELCARLRVPISQEKLDAPKAATAGAAPNGAGSVLHLLGVDIDLGDAEEMRLSPARLASLRARCREMSGLHVVRRKQFDQLVGVLSFCAGVLGGSARVFLRSLYRAQRRRGRRVRITRSMRLDLLWFAELAEAFNGVSLMLDDHATDTYETLQLFTDASLDGVAATFVLPDGTAEVFSARWDALLPGIRTEQALGLWHVSELEALGLLCAMEQWKDRFAGMRLVCHVDNEATVVALNGARGARDPGMQCCLRALALRQQLSSFQVRARHIDTKANWMADDPSRWNRPDGTRDTAVESEFYAKMEAQFGVARRDVAEVPLSFDAGKMLVRMRKAHGGKVHRLNSGAAP